MTFYALKQYSREELSKGDTIGIFTKEEDALDKVENNIGDLCENNYYPYVVVFPIEEGLYYFVNSEDEKWFKWSIDEECYKPIERPSFMDGWAIML